MGHTSILRDGGADRLKAKTPEELQFLRGADKNYLEAIMSKNTFAFCWLQVNSSAFQLQLSTDFRKSPCCVTAPWGSESTASFYITRPITSELGVQA